MNEQKVKELCESGPVCQMFFDAAMGETLGPLPTKRRARCPCYEEVAILWRTATCFLWVRQAVVTCVLRFQVVVHVGDVVVCCHEAAARSVWLRSRLDDVGQTQSLRVAAGVCVCVSPCTGLQKQQQQQQQQQQHNLRLARTRTRTRKGSGNGVQLKQTQTETATPSKAKQNENAGALKTAASDKLPEQADRILTGRRSPLKREPKVSVSLCCRSNDAHHGSELSSSSSLEELRHASATSQASESAWLSSRKSDSMLAHPVTVDSVDILCCLDGWVDGWMGPCLL
jgi:hypothetical protein